MQENLILQFKKSFVFFLNMFMEIMDLFTKFNDFCFRVIMFSSTTKNNMVRKSPGAISWHNIKNLIHKIMNSTNPQQHRNYHGNFFLMSLNSIHNQSVPQCPDRNNIMIIFKFLSVANKKWVNSGKGWRLKKERTLTKKKCTTEGGKLKRKQYTPKVCQLFILRSKQILFCPCLKSKRNFLHDIKHFWSSEKNEDHHINYQMQCNYLIDQTMFWPFFLSTQFIFH